MCGGADEGVEAWLRGFGFWEEVVVVVVGWCCVVFLKLLERGVCLGRYGKGALDEDDGCQGLFLGGGLYISLRYWS